jgi:hypothetical protein
VTPAAICLVTPDLTPGIQILERRDKAKDVNGRDKPGHDEFDNSRVAAARKAIARYSAGASSATRRKCGAIRSARLR